MGRVLFALPDKDFDVTEVSVPYHMITEAGHSVTFCTEMGVPDGPIPACDPLLLTGVVFGQLGADPEPKAWYLEMQEHDAFQTPISWAAAAVADFDALLLPGGHAKGMRPYLESPALSQVVRDFFREDKVVGAICHGVLVAARSGALEGRRTTTLPKHMERAAYFLTWWKLGDYYRTYDEYTADEVSRKCGEYLRGPLTISKRGTHSDDAPAFCVCDGKYVSSRWPGDAYLFARKFVQLLEQHGSAKAEIGELRGAEVVADHGTAPEEGT